MLLRRVLIYQRQIQTHGRVDIPAAVLYAVVAVSILQVTGGSVGEEDAQVLWTIDACRGNN